MKQLEIFHWNLHELFALDARTPGPPQLTSTGVVVGVGQTRINHHAKITRTCWCHRRSLVASYSIVVKHHFGMGDSASTQCKAMSYLAVRVSLTVAKNDFVARALSTANACNAFLVLILRTINSSLPTFLPLDLVYVKCSLCYHHPSTP